MLIPIARAGLAATLRTLRRSAELGRASVQVYWSSNWAAEQLLCPVFCGMMHSVPPAPACSTSPARFGAKRTGTSQGRA